MFIHADSAEIGSELEHDSKLKALYLWYYNSSVIKNMVDEKNDSKFKVIYKVKNFKTTKIMSQNNESKFNSLYCDLKL